MPNYSAPGPLFVVGIWRSGTSLLYTLLNQHPQIALMYEGDLLLLRPLFSAQGNRPDWLERWEFWNSALTRHNIETSRIPERVPNFQAGAEIVWKQYAGLGIYGDKSPNYYDSLGLLSQEFPNARFIVIWRDLADICRSIVRAADGDSFFSKRGITHRALVGYGKLKEGCDSLLSRGIPLHQIQYEEMIQDPSKVMAGVCQFLRIPFDPRMTSLEGANRSAIYEAAHHDGVKDKAIRNKEGREEVLSPRLRNKIERYVAYWKNEHGGSWPLYPKLCIQAQPGVVERAWDDAVFRAYRMMDGLTSRIYCTAPIGLLGSYRSAKRRQPEVEANGKRPALEVSTRG